MTVCCRSETHFIHEKLSHPLNPRTIMEQEKAECAVPCAKLRTTSAFSDEEQPCRHHPRKAAERLRGERSWQRSSLASLLAVSAFITTSVSSQRGPHRVLHQHNRAPNRISEEMKSSRHWGALNRWMAFSHWG